jgi:ankyrin repeat protein
MCVCDQGADVGVQDVHGWLPLHSAASGKAFKACELLLSKSKTGAHLLVLLVLASLGSVLLVLTLAILSLSLSLSVCLFVYDTVNVNVTGRDGATVLGYIARAGNLDITPSEQKRLLQLMMSRNADVNMANSVCKIKTWWSWWWWWWW